MLRSAGIPTRYVVGYLVNEYSPTEHQYVVRTRDAHAWVMAYVNHSWIKVDTTPGFGELQMSKAGAGSVKALSPGRKTDIPSDLKLSQDRELKGISNRKPKVRTTQIDEAGRERDGKKPKSFAEFTSNSWSLFIETIKAVPRKLSDVGSALSAQLSKRYNPTVWASVIIGLGLIILLSSAIFVWKLVQRRYSTKRKRLGVLYRKSLSNLYQMDWTQNSTTLKNDLKNGV